MNHQETDNLNIVYSIDKTVRDGRDFPQFRLKDIRVNRKEIRRIIS